MAMAMEGHPRWYEYRAQGGLGLQPKEQTRPHNLLGVCVPLTWLDVPGHGCGAFTPRGGVPFVRRLASPHPGKEHQRAEQRRLKDVEWMATAEAVPRNSV